MSEQSDIADVVSVLEAYFEGLYHADSERLADVFHADARYVNAVSRDYMNYSMTDYFGIVDRRTPPAEDREDYVGRIVSIEFGGTHMAFAKVSITMLGRNYLDFLILTFDANRWRIMSKVFSYTAMLQVT